MFSTIFLQTTPTGLVSSVQDTTKKAVDAAASALVQAAPTQDSLSLFEMVQKGGPVMIFIGILAVITIYVVIERIITIARLSGGEMKFMANIRDMVHSGNMDSAKMFCKNSAAPVAQIIGKGLSRVGQPVSDIKSAMEDVGKVEVFRLEKNMMVLNVVGRIAPLFGFVGTILGVIKIFYNIYLAGAVEIKYVADGLYEKMISSASGLTVGLVAFASYHILNMWIERIVNRMEKCSIEFVDLLHEPGK